MLLVTLTHIEYKNMNPKKTTQVIGEDGKPISIEVDLTPEELEKLQIHREKENQKRIDLKNSLKNKQI